MSYPTHLCPLQALEDGESLDALYEYTKIDPWFLAQVGRRRDREGGGGVSAVVVWPAVLSYRRFLSGGASLPSAIHPSPHLNKQSLASHPQLGELHDTEQWLKTKKLEELSAHDMRQLKQRGFSDSQIARAVGSDMMTGEHRAAGWREGQGRLRAAVA